MSIYRGSIGEISNKADWVSPIFEFVDDDTGEAIDLSDASDILFEIKDRDCKRALVTATLDNGKIEMVEADKFRVNLSPGDLTCLCEGQYLANFSFTLDGLKHDPILATITIIEGAG